ncbi:MAG: hypothetical protein ACXACX_06485 [Candidatus Hodarchaeales archaeon]|jgi:hypothetical protein
MVEYFVIFEVEESGKIRKLNITEKQFRENDGRDVLDSKKVLFIVKFDLRRIFIWKGANSHVRKQFLSSKLAQTLQEELTRDGYDRFKIVSITQGDEPFDGYEDLPFPFIFKPPTPPGDLGLSGQAQLKQPTPEEDLRDKPYCKNCGSIISEGQSICHVCKKRII